MPAPSPDAESETDELAGSSERNRRSRPRPRRSRSRILIFDGPDEPVEDETAPVPDPQTVAEQAPHQSGRGFTVRRPRPAQDLRAARPRVVLYFHLSDAAVRDGHGVVRPGGRRPADPRPAADWLAQTGCAGAGAAGGACRPTPNRWTATRSRPGCGPRCGCGRSPTPSRGAVAPPPPWIWTTPSVTCAPDDGGPPGQTGVDTLGPLTRSPAPGRHPRRVAKTTNPAPGCTCGGHRTAGSTWSPTTAPSPLGRTAYAHAVWQAAVGDHVLGA